MKYLIVGLGNIGPEYADTRHNAGFMVLDGLAKEQGIKFSTERYASVAEFSMKGRQVTLIKPTTYMNLSGKALKYWMDALKVPVNHVLVVVDDLAIPFGAVKMRPKGADAGHNGLKNINLMLGHNNYPRLRFGIGDNFPKGRQVAYVLSGFDDDEIPALPELISKSMEMVKSFVSIGCELTMTKFN